MYADWAGFVRRGRKAFCDGIDRRVLRSREGTVEREARPTIWTRGLIVDAIGCRREDWTGFGEERENASNCEAVMVRDLRPEPAVSVVA